MSDQIHLSGKEILEKDFKTAMRGYNQEEVDEFLDKIIKDYDSFQQEIDQLKKENEALKQHADQKKVRPTTTNHQVNYDVLKRLSNLEKEVFGRKHVNSDY